MSASATRRINTIYEELKQKYGRGGAGSTVESQLSFEILAIKQYLDELVVAVLGENAK